MAEIRRIRRLLQRRYGVIRIMRDRQNPLERFNETEVIQRYRFSRETILEITAMILPDIRNATQRGQSIPPLLMVCSTLRALATGAFQRVVGDLHDISQTSVSRKVMIVCEAIAQLAPRFIKFPTNPDDVRSVKRKFFEMASK